MKILITEPEYFDEETVAVLRKCGSVTRKRVTKKELESIVKDYEVLIVRIETRIDRKVLDNAKKLKVIGSATTGLEHINQNYAKKHGVKIFSLHGEHTVSTAEHTMALIFALSRRIPWANESMKQGNWKRYLFIGRQLSGKTLGIIGLGRIGSTVAAYARAIDMNVIYYDPYVNSKRYKKAKLESVMKKSDIVTIHAELTARDRKMIGAKEIGMMKHDAVLINTARAKIVDYGALIGALKKNKIAGAALDVFENEPVGGDSQISVYAKENDNLILTPHIGASTKEAAHYAGMKIANDVVEFLSSY
jgi:D-3-phosphoglycerate dehydrogenase / 2-oxoglutarate reductase